MEDEALITQAILAAVNLTATDGEGSDEWVARCQEHLARIMAMVAPDSAISRFARGVMNAKVFSGTVVGLEKEVSSTRAIVTLRTRPSDHNPDGFEKVRTDRTDSDYGLRMARRARSLVGHRVLVWVEIETMAKGDRKVRVLRHIEDAGLDQTAMSA